MSAKVIFEIEGQEPQELEFSDETWQALLDITKRNGITFREAFAQALANENYIESQIDDPSTKLLVAKGNDLRELVLR